MSDTKETEGYTTVELTLDNDEVIECAILTVTSATLKTMKNMKLQRMHLMNGWILRNSTNQTLRSNSDTKREGRRSFPFFSFT